jgi:putative acetyltransferase
VIVRRESAADEAAVRALHLAAFAPSGAEAGTPAVEARLVDELRADGDALDALCLVALDGDLVVGHVACSRGFAGPLGLVGLGPLGVLPARRGRGVGHALMHAVLGAADALGEQAVVLLGEPGYYGRFGFGPAQDLGLDPPDPAWGRHFQARAMAAWDGSASGAFSYAAAFSRL